MTNSEGYRDPTADLAIKRAMKTTNKLNLVRQIIYLVCKLGGVRLLHAVEFDGEKRMK